MCLYKKTPLGLARVKEQQIEKKGCNKRKLLLVKYIYRKQQIEKKGCNKR
jgi:hypothetical protein